MDPITVLKIVVVIVGVGFTAFWIAQALRQKREPVHEAGTDVGPPNVIQTAIGVVTDFFDTLGIGSFATTTAFFRFLKQCPDRLIPGTLNIGHTLPTVLQAYLFFEVVKIDPLTLILMIIAAVAGAWIGAGFVAGLPRRRVQIGMGLALLMAGSIILVRQLNEQAVKLEVGTIALSGGKLAIGIAGNFVLGALMTIGVGLYAPCLVLCGLLGMQFTAGFPIMMGSCAFLMPVASVPFIKKRSYSPRASLGLTLGGLPAVALAVWLVGSLDKKYINWLVIAVIAYTAVTMLRSAFFDRPSQVPPAKGET
jgi:uncharacterized membrane protein YfcA